MLILGYPENLKGGFIKFYSLQMKFPFLNFQKDGLILVQTGNKRGAFKTNRNRIKGDSLKKV